MDVFDILFRVGILGFIIYIILFIRLLYNNKLKGIYLFSFILFTLISLFTGHVFISTCVAIYPALLFLLNKSNPKKINNKDKRVLFISSTGGHFVELMELEPLFKKYSDEYYPTGYNLKINFNHFNDVLKMIINSKNKINKVCHIVEEFNRRVEDCYKLKLYSDDGDDTVERYTDWYVTDLVSSLMSGYVKIV